MSKERQEPTISLMRPEKDEIRRPREQAGSNGKRTNDQTRSARSQQPAAGRSFIGVLALFVALLSASAAAYLYWQFSAAQVSISGYEQRITQLEGQLAMTGDESQASMAAVQAKLKWADSEIRKLWGVAHDRNRKSIDSNTKSLAAMKKALASVKNSLKTQSDSLSKKVSAQQATVAELKNTGLRNTTQVQMMVDQLDQLESLQLELGKRTKALEQATASVDAFRRTVSRDILKLQQGAAGATP